MTSEQGRRFDDGCSRQFDEGTSSRHVIAETLARREGWAEVRPNHWSTAGAIDKALCAAADASGERQYHVEHRGGMTGRTWKRYTSGYLTDREQAHARAERRRQVAPEEEVRVRVRVVNAGRWKDDPAPEEGPAAQVP